MKCQVVLDEKSKALLDELARSRDNSRSFIVREASCIYAVMETYLDKLEQDPAFRRMMEASAEDVRRSCLHSQAKAERIVRRK